LQVDSEGAPTPKEFMDTVWGAVTRLYGEYGASLTGLTLIDYSAEEGTAVVRCTLEAVGMVRAALASITMVAGREAAVHVLGVSGTIKSLGKQ
jgi:ribonuclease P/MRP protein subunit POP5